MLLETSFKSKSKRHLLNPLFLQGIQLLQRLLIYSKFGSS